MTTIRAVKIVAVPPGAAPLEVRAQWVGLVLPLFAGETGPQLSVVHSVKRAPVGTRGWLHRWWLFVTRRLWRERGYRVGSLEAITLLDTHAPEAARWWRMNLPHVLEPTSVFVFHETVCEPVDVTR